MCRVNIDGFVNGLNQIERDLEESVGGTNNVQLTDLMPPPFITECTSGKFATINELFAAYPGEAKTQEEFTALIEGQEWNDFIRANTSYPNWEEMYKDAGVQYIAAKVRKAFGNG